MTKKADYRTRSFFKKIDKDIIFAYKGKTQLMFTKAKDSSNVDTRVKLIAGLNHFIYFVEKMRPEEDVEYVEQFIVGTYFQMITDEEQIKDSRTYDRELRKLIIEFCAVSDERLIDLVCRYVDYTTLENIKETKATTDITLTNQHVTALHVVGTLVKFSFIFSATLRSDMTFNQTLMMFVDKLCFHAFKGWLTFKEGDDSLEATDELSTRIDEFLYKLVGKHWDAKARTVSYVDKFKHIGIDSTTSTKKNKMDMCASLKKYLPRPITDKHALKYADEKSANLVYWTEGKDFDDFRFITLNTTKYIQNTLRSIVGTQDLNKSFNQEINVSDILVNSNDETSLSRDNSLYEDKEGHLLEIRQSSAINSFRLTVDEIGKYTFDIRTQIKLFNDDPSHPFNQFILSKIFLSITGEHRVYKDIMGVFNKVFLALFYIKVKDTQELQYMSENIEIMKCTGKPNSDIYSIGQIEEYLKEQKLQVDPLLFKTVLGVYINDDNETYMLEATKFYKLFRFLESPARVRHLLFEDTYSDIDENSLDLKKFTRADLTYANKIRMAIVGDTYDE